MPSFAGLSKFFGRTASEGAAFAAGVAVAPALSPVVREIVNEANSKYSSHPIDAASAAAIVAEDVEQFDFGATEASYNGINEERFRALLGEVLAAPGVPELLTLWRRDAISEADFVHGLRKAKLEARWDTSLESLKEARISPETTAVMVQRRVANDPGYLIDPPPISGSNVPPMPVAAFDVPAEMRAGGFNDDRAAALTRIIGLPPAPGELLSLLNRGVINEDAFNLGVVEGNTRQEWAPFLIQLRRRLLSPHEYAELDLRGIISPAERDAGAALSGMEPADTALLFEVLGRPLAVHQLTTGLARGGTFGGDYSHVPEPFQDAIRRSSIRPEYADLAYANRYSLPSPFVMRGLAQSKVWDEAKTAERLKWAGWIPEDADQAAAAWAKGTSTAAKEATAADLLALYDGRRRTLDETLTALEALGYPTDEAQAKVDVVDARRVVGAKQAAIGDLHTVYKKGQMSNAAAETALASLGVADWARPQIVASWETFLTAEGGTPPA